MYRTYIAWIDTHLMSAPLRSILGHQLPRISPSQMVTLEIPLIPLTSGTELNSAEFARLGSRGHSALPLYTLLMGIMD